jgi:hypothetical protein
MSLPVLSNLDFGGVAKPINLATPTASGDAATKAYVDSAIEGLAWKDSARVASVSNISLASPGATINGITMVSGDRVLLKDQTAPAENGVYIWNGAATPMTRALDASTFDELEQAVLMVEEGTSQGAMYRQTAVNGTLGTTAIAWATFSTAAPAASESTAGIAEVATQSEVDAGTDDARFVTPAKLAQSANRKRKFTQTIGDGSATTFTVTHNFGTYDVVVDVYQASGSRLSVLADVGRSSANAVTITFASAPASSAYNVVVLG